MVKDDERCQMEDTFIGCRGDGIAAPFTWRGNRLCRACMRTAMAENDTLLQSLLQIQVASRGWGKSEVRRTR